MMHSNCQTPVLVNEVIKEGKVYINNNTLCNISDSFISFNNLEGIMYEKLKGNRMASYPLLNKDIWFKSIFSNTDNKPCTFYYVMGNTAIPWVQLYEKYDSISYKHEPIGVDIPFTHWTYSYPSYVFKVDIAPRQTKALYLYANAKNVQVQFILLAYSESKLQTTNSSLLIMYGFFCGLMVLVFVINIYLYFITKDKIHFYYALYVFSNGMLLISLPGLDFQFLYPNVDYMGRIARLFWGSISSYLLVHVTLLYFNVSVTKNYWYYILSTIKWIFLALAFLHIYAEWVNKTFSVIQFKYRLYILMAFVGHISIITTAIKSIKNNKKPALFFLIAIASLMIGGLFQFLNFSGIASFDIANPSPLEYGMVVETIIISFGISYRYNLYKKQKEKLQEELSEQQSIIKTKMLEVQEEEQKRIAKDLHDELGGNLAAIKMQLEAITMNMPVTKILNMLDSTSATVRSIAHNLMPPDFEKSSLPKVLESFFNNLSYKTNFIFLSTSYKAILPKQSELIIYRIITELTNNIIKHAQATEGTIQLIYYKDRILIMCEDNGIGFTDNGKGIGLKNISSRVAFLKGTISIDSMIRGTTITICIPINEKV